MNDHEAMNRWLDWVRAFCALLGLEPSRLCFLSETGEWVVSCEVTSSEGRWVLSLYRSPKVSDWWRHTVSVTTYVFGLEVHQDVGTYGVHEDDPKKEARQVYDRARQRLEAAASLFRK